ncbi:MAG TPA: helix-turn-helix domain-containing protein, partial [Flavobacterium sp.]|nr:helix-turn-helix domain-containing protein [Flavobacterium sp.]
NERPLSDAEFITIDGVGKAKLKKYGDAFINAIIEFQKNKTVRAKKEGSTYATTLELLQSGLTVEEIAGKRNLGISTVTSHLAKLYIDGHSIDLSSYVTKEEIAKIAKAKITLESPNALKPYFDYFEEQIAYDKIRIGLAIVEKEAQN